MGFGQRIVAISIGISVLSTLSGCEPPPPSVADSGHPVVKVTAQEHQFKYTTKIIDGIEFKQSPYPLGEFGGTFYDSSLGSGPKTFNPHVSKDATSSQLSALMFVGLTELDPFTGDIVPQLAKTVDIMPDKMTYKVTLRKGLKWSDGKPITADDVAFTWNDIILPGLGNPSMRDILAIDGKLPTVVKTGPLTIEFHTPKPFAPFLANLGTGIMPKHVVEPAIRKNPKAFDSFWGVNTPGKQFVVNGPYVLDEYISGQRVVFKRNPNYFIVNEHGQRLPYMSRYIVEFVQDQNAQKLLFEQGRIDSLPVAGKDVFYVKHLLTPEFNLMDLGPSSGTTFLVLNLNPRKSKETGKPYVNDVRSRWFRNVNFRKALDYAIHREQIVSNILQGVGSPLFTAESLSSVFLNPKLAEGHPTDIDKAKALLKEAGFKWNAQGRLVDSNGHLVEFELMTNSGNLERESVGVAVKEDLEQLGIKVNFRAIDFNVLVGRMGTSQWEAVVLGLTGSNTEPHGGANVWKHDSALHLFNQRMPGQDMPGTDRIEPWERELDRLFEQGATTVDLVKRKPVYWQYQQVVYDNLPLIYLYSPKSIVAVRTRLNNVYPTPLGGVFHNIDSIWVAKKHSP